MMPISRLYKAPTQSLPALARLGTSTTIEIKAALDNLCMVYFPPTPVDELSSKALDVARQTSFLPGQMDEIVPDSGYASAEEEDVELEDESVEEDYLALLRNDPFERTYVLKWLTGFVNRADKWLACPSQVEESEREVLLEEAARLITAFSEDASSSTTCDNKSSSSSDGSIVRSFSFSTPSSLKEAGCSSVITVQLNDAPLSSSDHTSVGLQSWGSSIIFAERLCADPFSFSVLPALKIPNEKSGHPLRILELGAGTGLLSIATSKIVALRSLPTEIVATDYHADVLANLLMNVAANSQTRSPDGFHAMIPSVVPFDWQYPNYSATPFNQAFDVILAADVIYHPLHATWIKACADRLLAKPGQRTQHDVGGALWLTIPIRTTGRHRDMHHMVEDSFPLKQGERDIDVMNYDKGEFELGILELEEVARKEGTGRADESGYKLYKIGWVNKTSVS
ncbi:hypothetical protein AX17_000781 [Amanita inopinata Kibby_2008]|nr:hypothetical protein AX17_000781 [Amanita inopinata Kibby_2008]